MYLQQIQYNMEVKFYIKVKNKYELRELIPKSNSGRKFFEQLILNIDDHLKYIKNDMLEYMDSDCMNIAYPKHDDYVIQKKLDKLNDLRKQNLIARQQVKQALQENNFIICDCGMKMYKYPLGIPFRKIGTGYLLLQEPDDLRYVYRCEKCWRSRNPLHIEVENNIKQLREQLLNDGYNWVPNNFGLWYHYNNGKPLTKTPNMRDKI